MASLHTDIPYTGPRLTGDVYVIRSLFRGIIGPKTGAYWGLGPITLRLMYVIRSH
jgi:hypothetical protein